MRYYDYFHSGESDRFAFFRMPKILFTDPKFNKISTDSKVLYGLLLDRMDMSLSLIHILTLPTTPYV